jgi:hypothetical protein
MPPRGPPAPASPSPSPGPDPPAGPGLPRRPRPAPAVLTRPWFWPVVLARPWFWPGRGSGPWFWPGRGSGPWVWPGRGLGPAVVLARPWFWPGRGPGPAALTHTWSRAVATPARRGAESVVGVPGGSAAPGCPVAGSGALRGGGGGDAVRPRVGAGRHNDGRRPGPGTTRPPPAMPAGASGRAVVTGRVPSGGPPGGAPARRCPSRTPGPAGCRRGTACRRARRRPSRGSP